MKDINIKVNGNNVDIVYKDYLDDEKMDMVLEYANAYARKGYNVFLYTEYQDGDKSGIRFN